MIDLIIATESLNNIISENGLLHRKKDEMIYVYLDVIHISIIIIISFTII